MAPKDQLFNHLHNDVKRSDYRHTPYSITDGEFYINLDYTNTVVTTEMKVQANPQAEIPGGPLILNGEDMNLNALQIKENGVWRDLDRAEFFVDDKQLIILRPPQDPFELRTVVEINPEENTALQGIYKTGEIIGSQNKSRGFRHITYWYDRPDNLAKMTVTLEGDKETFPVMISNGNGNLHTTEDLGNGRHRIKWVDPWPKPSYLFATIAGDMKVVDDTFTTMSGKEVALRLVVPPGYEDQVDFAMQSIKDAMKWDEEKYKNEYDLDVLHLIGLEKFNMGAMENKGAIVFNIKDLCGSPETSTDTQLIRIAGVVAHEYDHNYSGDRVTIRDFFEISQKESLTELRNEQFQTDFFGGAVQTIDNAIYLRNVQFPQDAGPTAHCIRPEQAESFENLYSPTVYQKGSMVLRQLSILLGDDVWYPAIKHHFNVHDGQACTVEDLLDAVQDYSKKDLTQYADWWHQSGTPEVSYTGVYDEKAQTYTLTLKQRTPATPGQPEEGKKPFEIAVKMGLIAESGKDVQLVMPGDLEEGTPATTRVLDFTQAEQTFTFINVKGPVVPSLFRDFSAPVKLATQQTDDELLFRMTHDSDDFNRWDAGNTLMTKEMKRLLADQQAGKPLALRQEILDAYGLILAVADEGNPALNARMLQLPNFTSDIKGVDPADTMAVGKYVRDTLATTYKQQFLDIHVATVAPAGEKHDLSVEQVGRRELHNQSLGFLAVVDEPLALDLAEKQYAAATNMTERLGALRVIAGIGGTSAESHLKAFHEKYKDDTNVVDLWLAASTVVPEATKEVQGLLAAGAVDFTNPNKVRALMGNFAANTKSFHAKDGTGYKTLADAVIALNGVNDHTAAGVVAPLAQFGRYDKATQGRMVAQLERIAASGAGPQVSDIVGKALESAPADIEKKKGLQAGPKAA